MPSVLPRSGLDGSSNAIKEAWITLTTTSRVKTRPQRTEKDTRKVTSSLRRQVDQRLNVRTRNAKFFSKS